MKIRVFGAGLLPSSAAKPRAVAGVCRQILKGEGVDGPGEVNIVFLDREKMRALNKSFLGQDRDTDVIAFPYAEDPGPAQPEKPFGDIFISAHLARVQAEEVGHAVLDEVLFLTAHGTLHLLGYDDSTSRKRAVMFGKQERALKARKAS